MKRTPLAIAFILVLVAHSGCEDKVRNTQLIHHYAAKGDVDEVKKLLKKDKSLVSAVNSQFMGRTPLHTAAECGTADVGKVLLEFGADIHAKDHGFEQTALHIASEHGQTAFVEMLIEQKVDVNVEDKHQCTALQDAASGGHFEIAELLIKNGAIVDSKSKGKSTPLHMASVFGHKKVVELLLKHGADPCVTNWRESTPLEAAATEGHEEVAAILLKAGAKHNIRTAASLGEPEMVIQFLKDDPSSMKSGEGFTPLHLAAKWGRVSVVEALIHHKVDIDVQTRWKETPLRSAVDEGSEKTALLLLKHGAQVDARDETRGETPLFRAVGKKNKAMVELLLKAKANVNARDLNEDTPLHEASHYNFVEIAELLLKNGADLRAKNKHGDYPIEKKTYNPEMAALLEKYGK